jgi:predicted transcriptional regulator
VKSRAIEMYKSGMHSTQVAKQLGIGRTAVQRWCHAAGCMRTVSDAHRKDGCIRGDGYRVTKRNWKQIAQHREIAESVLQRPLTRLEVVHHVNDCKEDNRPANLWVFPSQAAHKAYHNSRGRIIHPDTIRLIPYCGEVTSG